jgi:class 3 adenylate cyclase/tetratricopeptide (TPR) repeat protein
MPSVADTGTIPCPRCGTASREAARFCDACGTPLHPDFAPQNVLEGEVKYITVLFADIVDSTQLVAERSPDEAETVLSPAVAAMIEAVRAFGGIVNQLLGDGAMALFGAPHSQEDHALRACCAALRMHEAVAASGAPVHLRVGLASGLTLLSTSGVTVAGAYPAFGATIHLASRLQALARPGTTLCAASTRALTGPTADFVPLGPRALRGFGGQQHVFVLAGLRKRASRFSEAISRGLSPLVGREQELNEFSGLAHLASTGSLVTAAIVGEAGAGKSRLAWEFTQSLDPNMWQVVQAETVSYGQKVPYQLIGALLRSALGIDANDEPIAAASRIRISLNDLDARACTAAVLSLLSLPLGEDGPTWDGLDPLHRRDALRGGVMLLFSSFGRHRPALLLIEDLQWADEQSLKLLDFSPESDSRLLILTTYRPQFTPAWTRPLSSILTLQPLSQDSMGRLLEEAFPAIASRSLRQELIARSAGNPFFLEELARNALTEELPQNNMNGDRQPPIPSTIQGVIAARLDRLAPQEKRVLVAASALGNRFSLRVLRGICKDCADAEFQSRLKALSDAGMFQKVQQSENELGFSHALIQEVAYGGLPRAQRRDLHAQIVATIKHVDADRLDEHAEMIVYHAAQGEIWDDLIDAARVAGRRAASRSAYIEASRIFDQAINACGHLLRIDERLANEIDLRFELRYSLFPTAGIERSLDNSIKAESLARDLGDRRRLGWATAYVARDLQLVGRPGAALVAAARALELADDDHGLAAATQFYTAQANFSRGDYASVVTTLRALISDLEERDRLAWTGTPGPSIIFFQAWLIWALSLLGDTREAEKAAGEMRVFADETKLPLCRTIAHLSEGFALAFAGRMREAETTLRESLSLCRKWEFFAWSTNISSCLGHVLAHLGKFEEAFDLIQQAVDRTKSSGIFVNHAKELAWLAEAHQLAGRPVEAAALAEKAIEVACLHEERGNEVLATVVLADASADLGSVVAANALYTTAIRLAIECGMQRFIERCRLKLASLEHPNEQLMTGRASIG